MRTRLMPLLFIALFAAAARAEEARPQAADAAPAAEPGGEAPPPELDARQAALKARYQRFHDTLLQMHQYIRKTDPAQAELLVRAIGQGSGVAGEMEAVAELLSNSEYGLAAEEQQELLNQLKSLLTLLQSEDRKSELEAERERIKGLLKDLRHVIGGEKDVRAGTQRGENAERLADRQTHVAGDAEKLAQKIGEQDSAREAERAEQSPGKSPSADDPSEQRSADQSPPNGKSGEGEPQEGESPEGQSGEGQSGDGEASKAQTGKGQSGQGQPGEGQAGEEQEPPSTPGREEIEQAREEMQRAIDELKQQKHDDASRHQDEALAKLEEAKEKLEEILRQLREEERELMLAALEARFQKMLAMQLLVYNGTVNLDKTSEADWQDVHRLKAQEMGITQQEIVLEADKALTLLKEDGSSVAFPEAVGQLREDMRTVSERLNRPDVGPLTQAIERDVIEALEEMIEAFQKEMEKQQESQSQPGQSGEMGDPSLVDALAELKMLRSLQVRINRRTKRVGELIEGEQATEVDLLQQLNELSLRQARVQEAAYDLATGRNR